MNRPGPQYLFSGSRLTDDRLLLRCLLEGLSTWSRQWGETITIQDDGSLEGLEHEVGQFKHLRHRPVDGWEDPNIVLCFMDRMSHNRASERLLSVAATERRPAFIISTYDGSERIAP